MVAHPMRLHQQSTLISISTLVLIIWRMHLTGLTCICQVKTSVTIFNQLFVVVNVICCPVDNDTVVDVRGCCRFAQFFLKPLFTESATEREVNAVNSENDKNLSTDGWRLHQLEKATCNPKHDFAKFGTGAFSWLLYKTALKIYALLFFNLHISIAILEQMYCVRMNIYV